MIFPKPLYISKDANLIKSVQENFKNQKIGKNQFS